VDAEPLRIFCSSRWRCCARRCGGAMRPRAAHDLVRPLDVAWLADRAGCRALALPAVRRFRGDGSAAAAGAFLDKHADATTADRDAASEVRAILG